MIAMGHTGIYVRDIQKLEKFYTEVFDMYTVCSSQEDSGELFDELLGGNKLKIVTTKLITPYGKKNGQGDMLELVQVISKFTPLPELPDDYPIAMIGMGHLAFRVDDMQQTVEKIRQKQGVKKTKIYRMKNENLCCFCKDPEGNWLELIKRNEANIL